MKRSDVMLVAVTIVAAVGLVEYCRYLIRPHSRTEERVLSARTKLVEKNMLNFSPIVIGSTYTLEEQALEFDGKKIWSSHIRNGPNPLSANFHVSPDERFIAFEDFMKSKPITILEMATERTTPIVPPKEVASRHPYGSPFQVVGWSEDSASLIVNVSGHGIGPDAPEVSKTYMGTWLVDPQTGLARRPGLSSSQGGP